MREKITLAVALMIASALLLAAGLSKRSYMERCRQYREHCHQVDLYWNAYFEMETRVFILERQLQENHPPRVREIYRKEHVEPLAASADALYALYLQEQLALKKSKPLFCGTCSGW